MLHQRPQRPESPGEVADPEARHRVADPVERHRVADPVERHRVADPVERHRVADLEDKLYLPKRQLTSSPRQLTGAST